jgi:hypothetical protein
MFLQVELDIKGSSKTVNSMVREFIIMQMEIREKDIGRMVKFMGMLYIISRMEGSIERSGMMGRNLSQF